MEGVQANAPWLLLLLLSISTFSFSNALEEGEVKVTNLVFYLHTKLTTPNETVRVVAGQNGDLATIQLGTVSVGDILLTQEKSNTSKQVGRLKIMVLNADSTYVSYPHAQEVMTAVIETEKYNGTLAINGRDIADGSELAIVGGTGDFRGVKGWANFTHVEVHPPDSITFVNASIVHLYSHYFS